MEKIINKIRENKKEIMLFMIILFICTMLCSNLIQMHIASDTYNLIDLGYFEYPSQYFLKDARIFSAMATYIAGILNLPYEIYIVAMEILAVIITSLSIYYMYKIVKNKIKMESNIKKLAILASSFIVIFNCMSLEYLLYAEAPIMCLSVLLCILATKVFVNSKKYRYIKSLILIILATFCYQGAVNFFFSFSLFMILIDNDKNIKEKFKHILLISSIIIISYLINIAGIYICNLMINSEQTRIKPNIVSKIIQIQKYFIHILEIAIVNQFNLWPKGTILVSIGITTILIFFNKKTVKNLIRYIVFLIGAFGICIVPLIFLSSMSLEPRMSMSIGAIVGLSIIYILSITEKNSIIENLVIILTIAFFVWNSIHVIQIFSTHIATNKIDENMGKTIKYQIESYEKNTNNKITKVAYYRDKNHRDFHYGWDFKYSSFSQRAFDNYFCIIEALNYYCNRKFEKVPMKEAIYNEYFANKDWDAYSPEQIVFKDDTMYICTY